MIETRPERNELTMLRLIHAAQGGDLAAYGELYRLHYKMVLGIHVRAARHLQDAEDLTTLTFLTMLNKLGSFSDPRNGLSYGASFRGWLKGVAMNLQRDFFARGRQMPRESMGSGTARSEWHRLSNIDEDAKTALCSKCGPVKIGRRSARYWQCGTQHAANRKRYNERNRDRYGSNFRRLISEKHAQHRREGLAPLPDGRGRSVASIPVSQEWVIQRAIVAVGDFNADSDHPFWDALDRAVQIARPVSRMATSRVAA